MSEKIKCKEMVWGSSAFHAYQCKRYVVGEHGFCKQHSPEERKNRSANQDAIYQKKMAEHRLKCAAPSLLAALEQAIEWDSHDDHDVPAVWLEAARAAISKAKGQIK